MTNPLATSYPRQWRGYQLRPTKRDRDYSSLSSLVVRKAPWSTHVIKQRPRPLINQLLAVIERTPDRFTARTLSDATGVDITAVRQCLCNMRTLGYPIVRIAIEVRVNVYALDTSEHQV